MLAKINGTLRKIFLIVGAVCVIFKLTEKKKEERKSSKQGFQTEEFDDIW
ncbi:MAG: hypothetical protein Q4C25_01335 [Bacillota bacterium]|nr:hypothetical protein [Bacillota bacterium]